MEKAIEELKQNLQQINKDMPRIASDIVKLEKRMGDFALVDYGPALAKVSVKLNAMEKRIDGMGDIEAKLDELASLPKILNVTILDMQKRIAKLEKLEKKIERLEKKPERIEKKLKKGGGKHKGPPSAPEN